MLRCAAYIRVSKNKEDQNTSIINQKKLLSQYAEEQGWTITEFYIDIKSGTSTERKNLKRLITDCENNEIDVILSKELSRLARNVELAHKIKRIIENNSIHLVTLDGAINTFTSNKMLFGLYAWIYEQEASKTSERIKHSLEARAKQGLFNGSVAPFGYDCIDSKLFIRNDETPLIVQRIFSEYIAGRGFDAIAIGLYNDDIPTPSMVAGKSNANDKWHGGTVRKILKNRAYIGDMVQLKEQTISVTSKKRSKTNTDAIVIKENTHEAIISKEDFAIVQELIKTRTRQKVHQSTHLFTNIMFCEDCGKGMHFKKNRRGYVCGSFNKFGKKACTDHIVREAELSDLILNDIREFILSVKTTDLFEEFKLSLDKFASAQKSTLIRHNSELESLLSRKSKALNKLLDDIIDKDDYDYIVKDINLKVEDLKAKISEINKNLDKIKNNFILNEVSKIKKEAIVPTELTPEILHRFVKRIEITKSGDAKVFYRFTPDELTRINK